MRTSGQLWTPDQKALVKALGHIRELIETGGRKGACWNFVASDAQKFLDRFKYEQSET